MVFVVSKFNQNHYELLVVFQVIVSNCILTILSSLASNVVANSSAADSDNEANKYY